MKEILAAIQRMQMEALSSGVSFTTTVKFNDNETSVTKIDVDLKYTVSTGDVSDRRSFVTSLSSEDTSFILNKKLIAIQQVVSQANTLIDTVNDIAETDE